jgi:hypothetical protein
VTEHAAIGPHDASPHAGQVVRRVLLRRNIVIDEETTRLAAAADPMEDGGLMQADSEMMPVIVRALSQNGLLPPRMRTRCARRRTSWTPPVS